MRHVLSWFLQWLSGRATEISRGHIEQTLAEQLDLIAQPRANHITGPRPAQVIGNKCSPLIMLEATSSSQSSKRINYDRLVFEPCVLVSRCLKISDSSSIRLTISAVEPRISRRDAATASAMLPHEP